MFCEFVKLSFFETVKAQDIDTLPNFQKRADVATKRISGFVNPVEQEKFVERM